MSEETQDLSEKPQDLGSLLDKIEAISGNADGIMQGIKTRADLQGSSWVMTPEQAHQLVATAAASTTIKLVSDYLEAAPAPSKIQT